MARNPASCSDSDNHSGNGHTQPFDHFAIDRSAILALPSDTYWMQQALHLATLGRGMTSPNPMVGCVVVREQRCIASGYHRGPGTPHAEVAALQQLAAAGGHACGADVFVNLEPCAHVGRTQPCVHALIAAKVRRVVVGMQDPNPLVNGRGIAALRAAGILVETGILAARCQRLNEAFAYAILAQMPFVIAKIAASWDGRIASQTGQSRWISNRLARAYAHRLRACVDAIAVGSGTALQDNPRLTCRSKHGRDPHRFVLDTQARLPLSSALLQVAQTSSAPTVVCVGTDAPSKRVQQLCRGGAQILRCRVREGGGGLDVTWLLAYMWRHLGLCSVLLEGGPILWGAMLDAQLINRLIWVQTPLLLGGLRQSGAILGRGVDQLDQAPRFNVRRRWRLGSNSVCSGLITYPQPNHEVNHHVPE